MLFDVHHHCFRLFECEFCFPQCFVQGLLDILDESLVHSSPPRRLGQVERPLYFLGGKEVVQLLTPPQFPDPIWGCLEHSCVVGYHPLWSRPPSDKRVQLPSIAVWDLVTSRCTARRTAQVNISMYALPSSFLFIMQMSGPAKSTPVCWKGLLTSVRNVGKGPVAAPWNGLAANTLQILQSRIALLTRDLSLGIHHCSLIAAIVLAVPRCIIRSCTCLTSFCANSPFSS